MHSLAHVDSNVQIAPLSLRTIMVGAPSQHLGKIWEGRLYFLLSAAPSPSTPRGTETCHLLPSSRRPQTDEPDVCDQPPGVFTWGWVRGPPPAAQFRAMAVWPGSWGPSLPVGRTQQEGWLAVDVVWAPPACPPEPTVLLWKMS